MLFRSQWGYSEFDPLIVSDTDASEQPPATLRFAKIDCEHAQYDITLASQMASSLANAILWDGKNLAEFQRMLYVLLRQVSVSSTFLRGQGAIVTILLESVARAHGLKLTWAEQLKPDSNRSHMTPDILALSGFDDAACLEKFKKNISLTRIQTYSESSGNSNSSVKKNI